MAMEAVRAGFPLSLHRLNSLSTRSSNRPFALRVNRSFRRASLSTNDITQQSTLQLMKAADGGSPRWFSPMECGSRSAGSPLLLFLPGIDGDGFGLKLQHKKLGQIFDIWCLDIPLVDRTPFADLVGLVEHAIRSENERAPARPIYLVGESSGASLALAVASRNPDIDLVLILANPASTINKSLLQNFVPLADAIYKLMQAGQDMSSILDTFLWKLKMINEMQTYLCSHLDAVKAQILILTSGKNVLLSSKAEGKTLRSKLHRCDIRSFTGNNNRLFLDDKFDLVTTIKGASYYRRGASIDYVSDFLPPTPSEYKKTYDETFRWMDVAFNPVMFSTMNGGEVVQGLAGIPSEGPVLLVGNHMMIGMDLPPLFSKFWFDRNILVRGLAHPFFFSRLKEGKLPIVSKFDCLRLSGGVPVTSSNMYKLLSSKSHVLLYPGGLWEAFHGRGDEYKLIWPAEPEFVRMAANFGAKIVPFATIGEDDVLQLLLDSNDQMKIPPLNAFVQEVKSEVFTLRNDHKDEMGEQFVYYPICLPKFPGRFYYLFGKPILTEGKKELLRDKDKTQEMYVEIQNEIKRCIDYLKVKREKDPYRNLLPRLAHMCFHGFHSQIPTFEI